MTTSASMVAVEAFWEEHLAALDGPLQAVCRYALCGGRHVRAGLLFAAAPAAGPAGVRAAAALEMMHTATLLQDDIFDAAHLRRGQTAVHVQFGKALAILASDWLLLTALELAAGTAATYFLSLSRAGKAMAQAEACELVASRPASFAEAERLGAEIARGKTGRLFGAALCGAAVVCAKTGPSCEAWEALGTELGVTYQMVDDCLDVYACEGSCGKDVGHDVVAGCMTLPLLLGSLRLQSAGTAWDVLEAVRSREVRAELQRVIARRVRRHRDEAQRLHLTGTAWESWIEALADRAEACLREPDADVVERMTEPRTAALPGI